MSHLISKSNVQHECVMFSKESEIQCTKSYKG